ncbi:iron-containing alcohol dehydrogenase [Bifidobacterium catenulatum subsp. kashiwanohense]
MRDFLIASDYAGIGFDTGGCAAVHALSYQLGGKYHMPHANPTTPCSPVCYATIWRSNRKARSLR